MEYGFLRVAAAWPRVSVGDCRCNIGHISRLMHEGAKAGVDVMVFPELCITGYTCMDLFSSRSLLDSAESSLIKLLEETAATVILAVVGLPLRMGSRLINAAVAIQGGSILGIVPKSYLPNYREYQERRWFTSAFDLPEERLCLNNELHPVSPGLIFTNGGVGVGIEICEDLWAPVPPSSLLAMEGANIILNPSASNETVGKHAYRRSLVAQQSGRCIAGYVYAMAGAGESSTDLVYGGGGIIAENGVIIRESGQFPSSEMIYTDIDTDCLNHDRMVNLTFTQGSREIPHKPSVRIPFDIWTREEKALVRRIDPHPFVPSGKDLSERCEEIFHLLVSGLMQRLSHIKASTAVVGISGGLDSTLALLAVMMTFERMGKPLKDIVAVTMPGFGTTGRTYANAVRMAQLLGVTLREIPIGDACHQHFSDIGHDESVHNVVYENSQARERTQILMDIANQAGGIVVGTGDMSELALGWATFNGDHISMYGINSGVPKTLVRHLVEWVAANRSVDAVRDVLMDIADTPISPELVPADESGNIVQKTESIVGPYELHDFFLYHTLRYGATPEKIAWLARTAFGERYGKEEIAHWLRIFLRRFFEQQYKRNCLPDGPKVGSVSLSPRGDWRMPSDAAIIDYDI